MNRSKFLGLLLASVVAPVRAWADCSSGFVGCALASTVCYGILDCDQNPGGPIYVYYTGNNPAVACNTTSACAGGGSCSYCPYVTLRIATDCDGQILDYSGSICCRDWQCCPV
jgi:hypothetical protein